MRPTEFRGTMGVLLLIVVLTSLDVAADLYFGSSLRHILLEASVILAASAGLAFLWRRTLSGYRYRLHQSEEDRERWRRDAERWRRETAQLLQGLGHAIDRQFDQWGLTASEKEVAMLLLKGLSQKEIAAVREVREKTIRQQSLAVYRKGGLAGRAELAAYFLEDLLLPQQGVPVGAGSPGDGAPGQGRREPPHRS